jgi:hypothetical protein
VFSLADAVTSQKSRAVASPIVSGFRLPETLPGKLNSCRSRRIEKLMILDLVWNRDLFSEANKKLGKLLGHHK